MRHDMLNTGTILIAHKNNMRWIEKFKISTSVHNFVYLSTVLKTASNFQHK